MTVKLIESAKIYEISLKKTPFIYFFTYHFSKQFSVCTSNSNRRSELMTCVSKEPFLAV